MIHALLMGTGRRAQARRLDVLGDPEWRSVGNLGFWPNLLIQSILEFVSLSIRNVPPCTDPKHAGVWNRLNSDRSKNTDTTVGKGPGNSLQRRRRVHRSCGWDTVYIVLDWTHLNTYLRFWSVPNTDNTVCAAGSPNTSPKARSWRTLKNPYNN